MKQFEYTIQDPLGIHARPAGLLVREVKRFDSSCSITKKGVTVKADHLMKLMRLVIKNGDTVLVTAEGADEDAAIEALRMFFNNNS